jgi:putative (di)nucleoside polyphosphate hydrolase
MIDSEGFRLNVGIILTNPDGQVFWAKRVGQNAWQFPQGGIRAHESPQQAMLRELAEEVGLRPEHVEIVGRTRHWLRYRLPPYLVRRHKKPLCIGQKQLWYVLRLLEPEDVVQLDGSAKPEFDSWRWVNYWHPLKEVVFFKRRVYERALHELAPLIFPDFSPPFTESESLARYRRELAYLGGNKLYLQEFAACKW